MSSKFEAFLLSGVYDLENVLTCWKCFNLLVGCAVLQLCYNNLSANVPTQLGSLKNLNVLALQYNHLTGAIPASLGDLNMLTRLDLSFNQFFGSIPVKLAEAPSLQVLDIRNNTLSGTVPFGNLISAPIFSILSSFD